MKITKVQSLPMRSLTCGCCNRGCTCFYHMDIAKGLLVGACAVHAAMPYAPLDTCYRWNARAQEYVRAPVLAKVQA